MAQLNYTLKRSKRRTLSIEVDQYGALIVRSPKRLDINTIENFINDKKNWIISKQKLSYGIVNKTFCANEMHLFLGESYPIQIVSQQSTPLLFFQNTFYLSASETNPAAVFKQWHIEKCKDYLNEQVPYLAKKYQFSYKSIRVNQAKTRWASCSYDNRLNFSYRLMQTPKAVIDYIIIHELSHTIHKNHGKDFWQLVSSIQSDYKIRQHWLKENSQTICHY